jgi:hypothetical protein
MRRVLKQMVSARKLVGKQPRARSRLRWANCREICCDYVNCIEMAWEIVQIGSCCRGVESLGSNK